jgi:flavin-dependent dehydrogenase
METYDIVIVGAGPAGLKCAEVLGRSELRTLLLEKKVTVGLKVCAGGLTLMTETFDLPIDSALSFRDQHIIFHGKEHVVSLKNPIRIMDRKELGIYQLSRLRKYTNVEVRSGIAVKSIGEDYVLTAENKRIHFKYLVGADGSTSVVRRHLGLRNKFYMGIQYNIPTRHDNVVWFFDPVRLKSGYGWIFPHKTYTSAGIFFNPRRLSSENARKALHRILDNYGMNYKHAKFEGAPINCQYDGMKFGNIFLIGDAAGLVSAGTGEGILYALASGEDVARHLMNGDYRFEKIKSLIKYKKRQEFILSIFDFAPHFQDSLFKLLIALLTKPGFQRFFGN